VIKIGRWRFCAPEIDSTKMLRRCCRRMSCGSSYMPFPSPKAICVLSAHPHNFMACGVYRVVVVIQMGDDIRNCSYSSVVDNEGSWPLLMKFPHLYLVSEENIFHPSHEQFSGSLRTNFAICPASLQSPSPCNIWHDNLILEHLKPNIPRIISPIFFQLLRFSCIILVAA
jgi:hypothetical protein